MIDTHKKMVERVKAILRPNTLYRKYWGKIIINAAKRGHFTEDEVRLSYSWTTCACGRQDRRLYKGGAPWDSKLIRLGSGFCGDVSINEFVDAATTLVQIESRAGELLSQMEGG